MSRPKWLVVRSQPHREVVAVSNLARQGFDAYCPMLLRRVRHARQTRDVRRPLFPGYLFVAVDHETQQWRPILSTFGVSSVVTSGVTPGSVPDGFIAALRAREIDGVIVRPETPYHLGQTVRLTLPAFDGLVAEVIGLDDNDRLLVLMTVLNRPVKIRVPAAAVSEIVGG